MKKSEQFVIGTMLDVASGWEMVIETVQRDLPEIEGMICVHGPGVINVGVLGPESAVRALTLALMPAKYAPAHPDERLRPGVWENFIKTEGGENE